MHHVAAAPAITLSLGRYPPPALLNQGGDLESSTLAFQYGLQPEKENLKTYNERRLKPRVSFLLALTLLSQKRNPKKAKS